MHSFTPQLQNPAAIALETRTTGAHRPTLGLSTSQHSKQVQTPGSKVKPLYIYSCHQLSYLRELDPILTPKPLLQAHAYVPICASPATSQAPLPQK